MELLIKLSVLAVGISYLNIREIVTLNLYAEINVNLSFFKVQNYSYLKWSDVEVSRGTAPDAVRTL